MLQGPVRLNRPRRSTRRARPSGRGCGSRPRRTRASWARRCTASVTSSPRWAGRQCRKIGPVGRVRHQRLVDLERFEGGDARVMVGVAHGDPGVGEHAVGARHRLAASCPISTDAGVPRAGQVVQVGVIVGRAGDAKFAAKLADGMDQAGADVVAVADPGQGQLASEMGPAPPRR